MLLWEERTKQVSLGGCTLVMSTLYAALTGVYLWNVENMSERGQGNHCNINSAATEADFTKCSNIGYKINDPSCLNVYKGSEDDMLDIHKMFNIVLLVMFIGSCITIASSLFMFIYIKIIAIILSLGNLVTFAGFIMLHIYRFNPAGKFCSGDYADNRICWTSS